MRDSLFPDGSLSAGVVARRRERLSAFEGHGACLRYEFYGGDIPPLRYAPPETGTALPALELARAALSRVGGPWTTFDASAALSR